MPNDPLRDALRQLAGSQASPGFTRAVLSRLDEAPPARWRKVLVPVAAVALVLLVALPVAMMERRGDATPAASSPQPSTQTATTRPGGVGGPQRLDVRSELAAIQADRQRLARDWREYRRRARAAEPVLYLGGNENVDLIFDLRKVAAEDLRLHAVPAAMTNRSDGP